MPAAPSWPPLFPCAIGQCPRHSALPPPPHSCRLRKDPLDPIDNGIKVLLLFKRLTDPEVQRREEEAKRKKEEAEAKAKAEGKPVRGNMKAGAWGGLPGR
jgi:hypothetical protein